MLEKSGEKEENVSLGVIYPIFVVEYDPSWPQHYADEARFLRSLFGPDLVTRIEHYGSTSVPGLAAKPVIDILVEVTSFEAAKREMIPVLDDLGYGHDWPAEHLAFFKGYGVNAPVKHHLHVAPGGHPVMDGLLFRDYLRKHPETARLYEELKYALAEQYRNDREGYTDAKSEFVREITERARNCGT